LVLSTLFGSPAQAVTAGDANRHRQAALEYIEVTRIQARLEALFEQIKQRNIAELEKWYITESKQREMRGYIEEVSRVVAAEISWANLRDDFIAAYIETYTVEELRGLTEFYRSPLGQAYLRKRNAIANQTMAITEDRLKALMPKLQALMDQR
jgi:hypothetical protein